MDRSTVTIELDGDAVDLNCTLDAMIVMSKAYGGMLPLYNRVKDADLEAITVAIRCGAMLDDLEARDLMNKVYTTGLIDLSVGVGEFVLLCASGGVRQEESLTEGDDPVTEVGE